MGYDFRQRLKLLKCKKLFTLDVKSFLHFEIRDENKKMKGYEA